MRRATTIGLAGPLLKSVVAVVSSVAAPAAVALLWTQRPAFPELPSSLSSPVTTVLLQQLVLFAAWFLSAVVIVLLLARWLAVLLVRAPRRLPRYLPAPRRRAVAHAGGAAGSRQQTFAPPFPLIPRARPESKRTPEDGLPERARPTPIAAPRIALLGPLKISGSKRRRRALRSQTQELLVYLALHKEGATTDELVEVLCPDSDDDNPRMRIWRAVSEGRSLGRIIVRAGEQYVLDRNAVVVDVDEFESLLAQASARRADREQLLERALVLVRGQPLAGMDYRWAAGEVRHLRARVVGLLHDLGDLRLENANAAGALAAAERAIELDAYNEPAHRLAMRAESVLRLRQAIVDRFERLRVELDAQFGLEPERDTRLLYRRLLGQS